MKKRCFAKLSLLAISLSALMNTNPAQAQFNDDIDWGWQTGWQKNLGYVGPTPIVLREVSPRLRDSMRITRQERRKLRTINEQLRPLETKLENKQSAAKRKKGEVDRLDSAVTSLESQITTKKTAIDNAKTNLPNLQQNAATAKTNLQNKRKDKKAADDAYTASLDAVAKAQQTVAAKNTEYRNYIQQCAATGKTPQQCSASPEGTAFRNELVKLRQEFVAAQNVSKTKKSAVDQAQRKVTQAKTRKQTADTAVKNAEDLIANGQTQLQQLRNRKKTKADELKVARSALKTIREEVKTTQTAIAPIKERRKRQRRIFQDAKADTQRIRSNLIDRVMSANGEGYREGSRAGNIDGNGLAAEVGGRQGQIDGRNDGEYQGTADGKQAAYNQGYGEGELVGEKDADIQGESDGKALGRTQGNQAAGRLEGTADGEERARRSNASSEGQKAGTVEGQRRAVVDGKRIGTDLGEREAINEKESKRLKSKTIKGQFAGIFGQQVPGYPGIGNPTYRYCDSYRREFIRIACRDGLGFGYFAAAENSYNQSIASFYNSAYTASYQSSYNYYVSQSYPSSQSAGFSQGKTDKYNEVYPQAKEYWRSRTKQQYERNPERNSRAYKNSFASATKEAYDRKYSQIYNASFAEYNKKVYDQNIGPQTAKYKGIRKSEVSSIYTKHPVLKFESIEIADGGKNGVGILDGVFMPEEDMVVTMSFKNFGKVEATNVKIKLANGAGFTLPTIPGESIVTLEGVARRSVRGTEGSRDVLSAKVEKKLYSNDKNIEGRHFYNAATGVVVNAAKKETQVLYPVQVTGLGLNGPLLLGQEQPLVVSMQKRANKTINGPLEVRVSTSLGSVLSQEFPSINKLSGSKTLSDAKVLVSDESDALKVLSFNAEIVKNGVTIGKIGRSGSKLVQVGYKAKDGAPVILGDAVAAPNELLDALADLGGIENVSVIDLALEQGKILSNGELAGKDIVLAQSAPSTKTKAAVSAMIKNNQKVTVILKDNYTLRNVLSASALNESASETTNFSSKKNAIVTYPSSYLDKSTNGSVLVTGAAFEDASDLGKALKKSNEELVNIASSVYTTETIQEDIDDKTLAQETKDEVKMVVAKVLAEAQLLNNRYKTDRKKARRIRKSLKKDKSDLVKMLEAALDTERKKKSKERDMNKVVSLVVVLDEVYVALDNTDQFKKMKRDTRSSVKERFTDVLNRAKDRALGNTLKRKIINRRNGFNKLAGNFAPFIERK